MPTPKNPDEQPAPEQPPAQAETPPTLAEDQERRIKRAEEQLHVPQG